MLRTACSFSFPVISFHTSHRFLYYMHRVDNNGIRVGELFVYRCDIVQTLWCKDWIDFSWMITIYSRPPAHINSTLKFRIRLGLNRRKLTFQDENSTFRFSLSVFQGFGAASLPTFFWHFSQTIFRKKTTRVFNRYSLHQLYF